MAWRHDDVGGGEGEGWCENPPFCSTSFVDDVITKLFKNILSVIINLKANIHGRNYFFFVAR